MPSLMNDDYFFNVAQPKVRGQGISDYLGRGFDSNDPSSAGMVQDSIRQLNQQRGDEFTAAYRRNRAGQMAGANYLNNYNKQHNNFAPLMGSATTTLGTPSNGGNISGSDATAGYRLQSGDSPLIPLSYGGGRRGAGGGMGGGNSVSDGGVEGNVTYGSPGGHTPMVQGSGGNIGATHNNGMNFMQGYKSPEQQIVDQTNLMMQLQQQQEERAKQSRNSQYSTAMSRKNATDLAGKENAEWVYHSSPFDIASGAAYGNASPFSTFSPTPTILE